MPIGPGKVFRRHAALQNPAQEFDDQARVLAVLDQRFVQRIRERKPRLPDVQLHLRLHADHPARRAVRILEDRLDGDRMVHAVANVFDRDRLSVALADHFRQRVARMDRNTVDPDQQIALLQTGAVGGISRADANPPEFRSGLPSRPTRRLPSRPAPASA